MSIRWYYVVVDCQDIAAQRHECNSVPDRVVFDKSPSSVRRLVIEATVTV